ncbi:hypothetical protein OHA04_27675 [Streptomyces sp. NBC_01590]|uniref:hypothetical protein n=1 Tax=Streptomyces sp. NBC_01590 TaxID=2975887 RepID=UPI00386A5926
MTGWLNLLTGAYTAGPPPAGTEACAGQPQQFEVGQWCDLDAQGEVIAPVLVEYEYDDNGQLIGVRTLTPGGDPYTVTGTLGICPGPVDDVEYVILCDTGTDGTVTEFLRKLTPNGDGTSTTRDTLLDGATAYTPVGRVGTCAGSLVPCGTGTGGTPGVSGPITSGNETLSSVALARPLSPASEHEVPGMGALITGGTWHVPATKCGVNTSGADHGWGALKLPAVPRPICDAGTVKVTIRLNYAQEGPDAGQASTGALFLMYHQPDGSAVQAGGHAFPQNTPAGSTGTREVIAMIPADRLAAGEVYAVVSAETWQKSFNVPPKCKAWTFSEWSAEFAYDVTGCPELPPPPLAQLVKVCPTDPIPVVVEPGKDTEVAVLCNTAEDGTVTQFLRAYQVDSESGQVGVVADTRLDGITPYEPLGEVGLCEPEPCQHCEAHPLCDVPLDTTPAPVLVAGGQAGARTGTATNGVGWKTSSGTNTNIADWFPISLFPVATTGPFVLTVDRPVSATWSARVGMAGTTVGRIVMPAGTELVELAPAHVWDAVSRTLSAAPGSGQAAANGESKFAHRGPVNALTFASDGTGGLGGTQRSVGAFSLTPATVPILRTVCRDCDGQVLDTTDTLLDGTPYTTTGTVGVCHPPEAEPCASTVQILRLCDLNPDVEPGKDGKRCAVPFLRHLVHSCDGDLVETRDTAMDGTTPYEPVKVVDCGSGGVPALSELLWPQTGIAEDPAGVARQDFIYTVTNPETGEVAQVKLHASSAAPGGCGTYDPANPVFNNPTTYVLALDDVAQQMSTFRLDLLDFDVFEGVTNLSPIPSRVEGDVTWTGSTIKANASNITAYVYFDSPPAQIAYRYGNTGGGSACSAVRFQGMTLVPDGCCGCSANGGGQEPCRDSSSTLLCDTVGQEAVTVFDPVNRPGADGWEIVSYTGYGPGYGPEAAIPYPAPHPAGSPGYMGVRSDLSIGPGPSYASYDTAPVRWVMRKTFDAPEDGVAVVSSTNFRGDGGARVRINSVDAGMYGQWNMPATSGTAQIPVTAGPNVVEIEVRDGAGENWIQGRLDIVMTRTMQFMRRTVVDCETGATVSVVDTTLDGDPYTVTGEVGQCETLSECCEQPPPEQRVDVETKLLCILDANGEVLDQVLVEHVYDDQTGDRVEQRLTDPTTGALVTLPAGATLGLCDPPCPTAFSTECVGVVERTEASYDNTSLIGGVPGKCGSVQGPGGAFACETTSGQWTITSWIVDGVEVIAEGSSRSFAGGPCGPGTAATPGMHLNWAQALTNLDPSGATWSAQDAVGCAWHVRSSGGTGTVYGPMTITGNSAGAPNGTWALGPAQACTETQYTKVYVQDCDGTVSVKWLTAEGVETDAPDGDYVPCGTGCGAGGGQGLDVEVLPLCDVQADGASVQFLRHLTYDTAGAVSLVVDTGLDGIAPYAPTGTVGVCSETRLDVETELLCVRDTATGEVLDQVLVERVYDDETGDRLEQRLTDPTTGDPVELPAGAVLARCPSPDRITRQICVVETGKAEFLTNTAGAAAGQDTDWQWSPSLSGTWYPMYRVAPNPAWTLTDSAPNPAHWVAPHQDKTVCSPNPATAPNVSATWFTRASWQLPVNVDPDTIRIAASVLNADNGVIQWRLNDGAWQPVSGGGFTPPAWAFPPSAVPGGRAGQNEIVVQLLETAPPTTCPSPNQAGMMLHVLATYDYEPRVWTQVIEDGGRVYYLDETGTRQDVIPDGQRIVPCGGGDGGCCPTEECRDTSTVLLCDLDPNCQAGIEPTATDEPHPASFNNWGPGSPVTGWCLRETTGQGAPVWTGGAAVIGPDPACPASSTGDTHRAIGVHLAAGSPSLTGAVSVTVSLRATNNGPHAGWQGDGRFALWDASAGARLTHVDVRANAPVGSSHTLTLTADVPAAALATGDIVAILDLETYHGGGPKAWTVDEFKWSAEVPPVECEAQFLRTIVKDCTTGATVSVVDTTLDGEPYEVTGDVGECTSSADSCPVHVIEQCRCDDADGDGVGEVDYVELVGVDTCTGDLTVIGTYTEDMSAPYTPVSPVACEPGGAPTASGVQAHRVDLDPGETWDATARPTLQSVTAVARGTGTVTTADGTSALVASESVTWSVARDSDARLTGPLTVTATTGTVAVSWTTGVNL